MKRTPVIVAALAAVTLAAGCGSSGSSSPAASSCDDGAYNLAAGWASRTVADDLWSVTNAINSHVIANVVQEAPSLTADARAGADRVSRTRPCATNNRTERTRILHALRLWERVGSTLQKVRPDGSNLSDYSATVSRLMDAAAVAGKSTRLSRAHG